MIHYEYINEVGKQLLSKIEKADIPFSGDAIVFAGALGICVRKILPMVHDKYSDPAVVCIDTTGKWVIPVLSGHVGGANELARKIAAQIGAQAVITTQSDNLGLWPLDTLAQRFGWEQKHVDRVEMNKAIAAFVNGEPTALYLLQEDEGTRYLRETCPAHVSINPENGFFKVKIVVADNKFAVSYNTGLTLGFGCQKNVPAECADQLLAEIASRGIEVDDISTVATIDLKKDEPMLERLCHLMPWVKKTIYSAEELSTVDVPNPSEKVFEVTGCYGVAEASAMKEGKTLLIKKTKGCFDGAHYTWAISSPSSKLSSLSSEGHIEIVGAGPGDPELVSVRGKRFLENADLILYAGSLVPKELTYYAKSGCVVRSSADMNLEEQFALMKEHYDKGHLVVRLHTGDPCIYGAIQEQMAFFDEYKMDYHITPGISSFLAAAAELKSQFTIPEKCQTIILTRGEGRTPMPDKEKLHMLASHQSTMCIFLSAGIVDDVQKQLLEGGYPPETPVAACYKLTWKEQKIFRGQLKDLASIVKGNGLTLTTMIVVGDAIDNRKGLSKLYDKNFSHLFR